MKKILFATDDIYLGGGEIALLGLIGELEDLGFKAILIIPKAGPLLDEAKDRSIDVRVVDMPPVGKKLIKHPVRFLKSFLRLTKIVRDEDISYLFANSLNAGICASLAAKPFGVKTIWYCWGYYFPKDKFWQHMYRFLFDGIAFCSYFVKERMRIRTFKEDRLPVIYPGVESGRFEGDDDYFEALFRRKNGILEGHHVFSIIGRLDRCKNHSTFLDIANEIARQDPKSYFLIAGGTDEAEGGDSVLKSELEEKIKGMPLIKGRIIFTGFVRDVKNIIKSSKIIFSCTGNGEFGESFGLSIVEAMLAGRAVIATSIGGPTEIIRDGFNGFLAKPGDYKAMAEKAACLINLPSLYSRISENAKKDAAEKYTITRFAKDIIKML